MKAPVVCIKVRLGHCRNMPTATLYRLLDETARACDDARNACFRFWQRWREDNPTWSPGVRVGRDGKSKSENIAWSNECEKLMYATATGTASNVAAKVIASCCKQVREALSAKTPYGHAGNARLVWDAVLRYEIRAPFYRDDPIPVPCQDASVGYDGVALTERIAAVTEKRPSGVISVPGSADVLAACDSAVVLRFPLLSKNSSFKTLSPIVSLDTGGLNGGRRRWLRMVADGRAKLCDSELVKDSGSRNPRWYAHLVIRPPLPDSGPDQGRIAVLTPMRPGERRPFEMRIPGDEPGTFVTFGVGDGRPYEAQYLRKEIRERAIKAEFRGGFGAGHGRGRVHAAVAPVSRGKKHLQKRFTNQLMADVIQLCLRNNCGTLEYREPTMPLRDELWFSGRGLPFNWSQFASAIAHKCERSRIATTLGRKKDGSGWPRLTVQDHKDEYPDSWKDDKPATVPK